MRQLSAIIVTLVALFAATALAADIDLATLPGPEAFVQNHNEQFLNIINSIGSNITTLTIQNNVVERLTFAGNTEIANVVMTNNEMRELIVGQSAANYAIFSGSFNVSANTIPRASDGGASTGFIRFNGELRDSGDITFHRNTFGQHRGRTIRFAEPVTHVETIRFIENTFGALDVGNAETGGGGRVAAFEFSKIVDDVKAIAAEGNTISGRSGLVFLAAFMNVRYIDFFDNVGALTTDGAGAALGFGASFSGANLRVTIAHNKLTMDTSGTNAFVDLPTNIAANTVQLLNNTVLTTGTAAKLVRPTATTAGTGAAIVFRCNKEGATNIASGADLLGAFPVGSTVSFEDCGTCKYSIDCNPDSAVIVQRSATGACACECAATRWDVGPLGLQCRGNSARLAAALPPVETPPPVGKGNAPFEIKSFQPDVPLDHCVRFGPHGDFQLEWQLNFEDRRPKNSLQIRYTADLQRGFSSLGLTKADKLQLMSGYPQENLDCARSLYDTFTPYAVYGDVFPNYPEVPANLVHVNTSHASHYLIRNLTVSESWLRDHKGTMKTNVTLLWGYMQSSLFGGGCYQADIAGFTEMATIEIALATEYKVTGPDAGTGKVCNDFTGSVIERSAPVNGGSNVLEGERAQNKRVAALLFGGNMLVESGNQKPQFDKAQGLVKAGENRLGVCQESTTKITVFYSGFSDDIGGITEYVVSVGPPTLPHLYADRVSAAVMPEVHLTVDMPAGIEIVATVTAFNFANLAVTAESKTIFVLNNGAPINATMVDGTVPQNLAAPGGRMRYQKSASSLTATWTGWQPQEHSDRDYDTGAFSDNGFEYAVGIKGSALDGVVSWTTQASFATTIAINSLALTHGATYVVSTRASNCAGRTTLQTSPGVTIDTAPPHIGTVRMGNSTTVDHRGYMNRREKVHAKWTGFFDTISGIRRYEWAVSNHVTAPNANANTGLILPWSDVGLATSVVSATAVDTMPDQHLLGIGAKLYIHVKAVDVAGNYITGNSNATLIAGY